MSRNTDYIPFARPSIGAEEEQAVLSVLRSGWLTTAGEARTFEQEFARRVGAAYALAVNSATAGLHLSLEALGIGPGDNVVTTPFTFTATAEVIRYLGAHIRFADIEEESLTIDPGEVERVFSSGKRPKAIIPVHLGGRPCRIDELTRIGEAYGAAVVEDAAHAFPVQSEGRYLGTLGTMGVYSFYATKTITTGEGGMVVTEDEALAERIRKMRLHGIDREVWNRYTEQGASWSYDVVAPGYKYNLPDIAAALGRVQLTRADEFLARRREIARRYLQAFADLDFIQLPASPQGEAAGLANAGCSSPHAWHLFILRIDEEKLRIDRDRFIELLAESGIGASVHYIPLHLMSYYRKTYNFTPEDFPVSLRAYRGALSLPIYPALEDEEVERIISAVRRIGTQHYRAVYPMGGNTDGG